MGGDRYTDRRQILGRMHPTSRGSRWEPESSWGRVFPRRRVRRQTLRAGKRSLRPVSGGAKFPGASGTNPTPPSHNPNLRVRPPTPKMPAQKSSPPAQVRLRTHRLAGCIRVKGAPPFTLHLPLFSGVPDTCAAQIGATRVVRARRMSPRLQEILCRPKPAVRASPPPKPFGAGHAGAEKLSPSSIPAPNETPDLRDASALKFGVCRYISQTGLGENGRQASTKSQRRICSRALRLNMQ